MDTRNQIKSYIVREGMTMADLVEKLADQYGWSASVLIPNRENPNGAAYCVRRWARRCFVWIAVQKVPFVRCFHMD